MAKPELGIKRQCLSCAAKFYDLNRDPILCPKCGTPFQVQQLARRGETAKPSGDEEDTAAETAGAVLVPLEEADGEQADKELPGDDIDLGEDLGDDDDDTFLEAEEEEDDGDVSDLIGSDIEEDDEN